MADRRADRLLIVEDHELLATSLAFALRQQGLDVETVAGPTVDVVVGTVRRLAPVLVLLDLDLGPPLGSGLNLVQPLMAAGGQVIMMTGVVERARLGACIEAGAVGIVSKTAGFDELVGAIRRAVAGEDVLTTHQRHIFLGELQAGRLADEKRRAPFATLSPREQAVLARLVSGESADTIAHLSYVSLATIRTQIRSILTKLGVKSQLEAVALARQAGWPQGSTERAIPDFHQSWG
ncbi:MAG: two-component system, NarL family, nitrate/nitrite response regulator NarL [Acidimicrobiaceae bacterium]|nr:two-component system, NarL family, nitrate/nitrite response regulator NarL [Acidimicrobiaceae bacterium]MDQ1364231.1 two-component system, NarL family, nitrate/nitrite response regulator NarL [Acidimicrobiaceae bacterium]MDQ1369939.1 two-component system, NarL family, nitrate/nitrite response regulator NarL [Acidimicrobiaceae bacterium]